jgi:hypothetical protein
MRVALLFILAVSPLSAQEIKADSLRLVPADTGTWAEGRADGRAAGSMPPVAGRAVAGFAGGVPVGFFGILSFAHPVPAIATVAGAAAVIAAVGSGSVALPPSLSDEARRRSPSYAAGFAEGYADRLRSRRRTAAIWGGVAGTASGFALLVLMLSQINS